MNSSNKNTEKVWNLVIKTRQDIHQAYYVEILKFCETVLKKKKSLNFYPKTCSSIMKMLQLIKHSLWKVFMAKHLVMGLKTSLFTKFGTRWLLAPYKIEIHIERTKISRH